MTGKTTRNPLHRATLLLILGSLLPAACDSSRGASERARENSALAVTVEHAVPANEYTVRREYLGRVEPARQSQVGFELGGTLFELTVEEGDAVAAGENLARLDTARLEARLAEAEAMLNQALSARQYADRTLERSIGAAEFDGISGQELDVARDNAATAAARVAAARAGVNSVQVDLGKSVLTAPYDAVVVRRRLDEGQPVAPGQAVLDLQELAPAEVRIGTSGDLAASMLPGQSRQLLIGTRKVRATVRSVIPLRNPSTRTVDVILQLAENSAAVPGDLARLQVEQTIAEDGFWLPIGALAEGSRGLWVAYAAVPLAARPDSMNGATHYLEPRPLEVIYQDTSHVFVRGALDSGDRVVTGGLQRVVPNQEVRIVEETAAHVEHEEDGS